MKWMQKDRQKNKEKDRMKESNKTKEYGTQDRKIRH